LFLELFAATLSQRFPAIKTRLEIDSSTMEILSLPALIAQKLEIRVAVFLANSQLFLRFSDTIPFLRMLKLLLKNQQNCIFCFYGINHPYFGDLIHYPGPLSGLGQLFELRHNPLKHRSVIIRKFFHDHNKSIGFSASNQMSYMVDNHPGYLKLLAWHALIRTRDTCTTSTVEKALSDLIHHFDLHFYNAVKSLTSKQINFLKALVQGNQKLYSKSLRDEYHLGTTSNIVRIKQSLERKEILVTRSKESVFVDPIFREWLRRRYFSAK
jgi:hypothetical protein